MRPHVIPSFPGLADPSACERQSEMGLMMHALIRDLFPLPRSITGEGLRATVRHLGSVIPLEVTEVPSRTAVFDWQVPDEWALHEAFIEDPAGRRIVDGRHHSLHVVNYSVPVDTILDRDALLPHLYSLPEHPDWIPYRTSYYAPTWGFCVPDRVRSSLEPGAYRVVIRSTLVPGSLTLAEWYHRGTLDDEVLIFAHDCHPSLANDNLSGMAVATYLARWLSTRPTRYSYRVLFAPATIGTITWLALREEQWRRIRHGLILAVLGGEGPLHYKVSRRRSAPIDRAACHLQRTTCPDVVLLPFAPIGFDERQFCSPGINLPVGRLTRIPEGWQECHTSADTPDLIRPERLAEAWIACLQLFDILEGDVRYRNQCPRGEPQLGRRGLYRPMGGHREIPEWQEALAWVLNGSDGESSLLDIAEQSGLPFHALAQAAGDLVRTDLLVPAEAGG